MKTAKTKTTIASNNEGISSWDSKSRDGLFLTMLVDNGCIDGMKPMEVRKNHSTFHKYAHKTFTMALNNARRGKKAAEKDKSREKDNGKHRLIN